MLEALCTKCHESFMPHDAGDLTHVERVDGTPCAGPGFMVRPLITPDQAGTWLEGAQGWHNTYRVIDLAAEFGGPVRAEGYDSIADERIVDAYRKGEESLTLPSGEVVDVHEAVAGQGGLADQATDFLQTVLPHGFRFDWDAGELAMVSDICAYHTMHNGKRWCDSHDSAYPCPNDESLTETTGPKST